MSMCCAESKRTRSLRAMRPESGVVSPATQSSKVVLPAPEGPNKIVKPGAAGNSTSRLNVCDCAARRLWNRATSRGRGSAWISSSVGRADAAVISADHQHYAEFSHGMSEAEGCAGNQSGNRERNDHAKKSAERGSAQCCGCSNQFAVDACE